MKKPIKALLICIILTGCASPPVHLDKIEERVGSDGSFLAYRKGDVQPFTGKAFDLHPSGSKKEERTYREGRETGMYRTWYANGQKQEEVYHVNGSPNGKWREWYEDGQIEIKGTATNGFAIGRLQKWNADGSVAEDQVYPDGGIPQQSESKEGKQNKNLEPISGSQ